MYKNHKCIECGYCCYTAASFPISKADIKRSPEIEKYSIEGEVWYDPETKEMIICPFYSEESCLIYDKRPQVCRDYPRSREQALFTECKGVVSVETESSGNIKDFIKAK